MIRKNNIVSYRGIIVNTNDDEVIGMKGKFIREDHTTIKELSLKDTKNINIIVA